MDLDAPRAATSVNTAGLPLEHLTLEAQVSAAMAWNGDRPQLDALMLLIQTAFKEHRVVTVQALCEELLANTKLPPVQRAHSELWMSFRPGQDAGERLDTAERWLNSVKNSLAPYYLVGTDPYIAAALETIERLRSGLVTVDDDNDDDDDDEEDVDCEELEADAVWQECKGGERTMPIDILTPTPASQLTKEQIGPEIPLKKRIRRLEQAEKFARESADMGTEAVAAGMRAGAEERRRLAEARREDVAVEVSGAAEGTAAAGDTSVAEGGAGDGFDGERVGGEGAAGGEGSAGGDGAAGDEAAAAEMASLRCCGMKTSASISLSGETYAKYTPVKARQSQVPKEDAQPIRMQASNEAFQSGSLAMCEKNTPQDLEDMFKIGDDKQGNALG